MLRPIDLSDDVATTRIVDIQKAAYRLEADLIGFDGIPQLHESLEDLPIRDLDWLGSWEGDVFVGLIAWRKTASGIEIDRLAVHPAYHRRGHGRALVESLLHRQPVTTSTGTGNEPAMRMYKSLGFRRAGLHEIAPDVTITELHWVPPTR